MLIWNERCTFSPSLICLDMCNLESQVKQLERCGVKMLHVDILDGHFSPSMPLGLDTVRQLRAKTGLAFDCHVMVTEQDYFVDELLDIGVEQIVFHAETQPHIDGMLNRIHARGVRAGVAAHHLNGMGDIGFLRRVEQRVRDPAADDRRTGDARAAAHGGAFGFFDAGRGGKGDVHRDGDGAV